MQNYACNFKKVKITLVWLKLYLLLTPHRCIYINKNYQFLVLETKPSFCRTTTHLSSVTSNLTLYPLLFWLLNLIPKIFQSILLQKPEIEAIYS